MMQAMKKLLLLLLLMLLLGAIAQEGANTTEIEYTPPPSAAQAEEEKSIVVRSVSDNCLERFALDFPESVDIGISSSDSAHGVTTYELIARMGTNALVEEISKQLATQGWGFRTSAPRASRGTPQHSRMGGAGWGNDLNNEKHFYSCAEKTQRLVLELAPIGRSFQYTVRIYLEDVQTAPASGHERGAPANER